MASNRGQSERAYHRLRKILWMLTVPPGTRLTETEWAQRLQVNRVALREAMSLLAHEGLLSRGERGGYFVPRLEQADIVELVELRKTFELGAVRIIGRHPIDDPDYRRLLQVCQDMQRAMDAGYDRGFQEADLRFHELMVRLCRNHRLIQAYLRFPSHLLLFQAELAAGLLQKKVLETAMQEHLAICEGLKDRRIDDVLHILKRHLNTALLPGALTHDLDLEELDAIGFSSF